MVCLLEALLGVSSSDYNVLLIFGGMFALGADVMVAIIQFGIPCC